MRLTPDAVFSAANTLALAAWIVLAVLQRKPRLADAILAPVVGLIAVAYAGIIATHWAGHEGGFSSLTDVAHLFADRWLLLAGWLHYLAFDLLVGRWEARDAAARDLSPWLVGPCLALTFLFGPAGWLAYLGVRVTRPAR